MFPLKDNMPSLTVPVITWLLIAANVLVFLLEMSLGTPHLERFLEAYGLVPAHFVKNIGFGEVKTIYSSMFLHAGFLHLFGNMWFLYLFGDNVEDFLGHWRYLIFYLFSGTCAAMVQVATTQDSISPMIGASGAISGVLGAYCVLFPESKVITLVPIYFVLRLVELPAAFFLGLWFVIEFFSGFSTLAGAVSDKAGGVAFWAHIGGFVVGALIALPLRKKKNRRNWYLDEYRPW